ncbi:hypothetical protein D9M69_723210 [compost metagenome]
MQGPGNRGDQGHGRQLLTLDALEQRQEKQRHDRVAHGDHEDRRQLGAADFHCGDLRAPEKRDQ